jgi:hypothetical protein
LKVFYLSAPGVVGSISYPTSIGVDSTLPDNFGRSVMYAISAFTTIVTISIVGGLPFVVVTALLGVVYYNGAETGSFIHRQTY